MATVISAVATTVYAVAVVTVMQLCSYGVADEVVVGEEMLELLFRWMFLLILLSICRVLKCNCHHKC